MVYGPAHKGGWGKVIVVAIVLLLFPFLSERAKDFLGCFLALFVVA